MAHLILASASPARARTLRCAGIDPTIIPSAIDEDQLIARYDTASPADIALLLARAKCEAVAALPDLPEGCLVVGCDSVLDLDGRPLGKPHTAQEATNRWQQMRGRSGMLHTGHWIVDRRSADSDQATGSVASTEVHFASPSDAEIAAYVASGEPLNVAGAFTVDGLGGAFVRAIEGDYHNVVGISLPLLRELVAELGVIWPQLWTGATAE